MATPPGDAGPQLISYIAPAAPATRRPATGAEPFLRPEIGFTPRWYRDAAGCDFGERWHNDPACRRDAVVRMGRELDVSTPLNELVVYCAVYFAEGFLKRSHNYLSSVG